MAAKKNPQTQVPARPAKSVRQAKPAPAPKAEQPPSAAQGAKLSALDAAARVLGETGQALTCKELIDRMAAQGY